MNEGTVAKELITTLHNGKGGVLPSMSRKCRAGAREGTGAKRQKTKVLWSRGNNP
jgi:hypothetical protein